MGILAAPFGTTRNIWNRRLICGGVLLTPIPYLFQYYSSKKACFDPRLVSIIHRCQNQTCTAVFAPPAKTSVACLNTGLIHYLLVIHPSFPPSGSHRIVQKELWPPPPSKHLEDSFVPEEDPHLPPTPTAVQQIISMIFLGVNSCPFSWSTVPLSMRKDSFSQMRGYAPGRRTE